MDLAAVAGGQTLDHLARRLGGQALVATPDTLRLEHAVKPASVRPANGAGDVLRVDAVARVDESLGVAADEVILTESARAP